MVAVVLIAGLILASLPLMGERSFMALPLLKRKKSLGLRVLEFGLAYGIWLVIGKFLESQAGQVNAQGWEFYAVTFLLFVLAAFPVFTWRYLWRRA